MKESDDNFITEKESKTEAAQELIDFAEAYIEVGKSANASLEDIEKGISFVTKAIELLEDQGSPQKHAEAQEILKNCLKI